MNDLFYNLVVIIPSAPLSESEKQFLLKLLFVIFFVSCIFWWVEKIVRFLIFIFKRFFKK